MKKTLFFLLFCVSFFSFAESIKIEFFYDMFETADDLWEFGYIEEEEKWAAINPLKVRYMTPSVFLLKELGQFQFGLHSRVSFHLPVFDSNIIAAPMVLGYVGIRSKESTSKLYSSAGLSIGPAYIYQQYEASKIVENSPVGETCEGFAVMYQWYMKIGVRITDSLVLLGMMNYQHHFSENEYNLRINKPFYSIGIQFEE